MLTFRENAQVVIGSGKVVVETVLLAFHYYQWIES